MANKNSKRSLFVYPLTQIAGGSDKANGIASYNAPERGPLLKTMAVNMRLGPDLWCSTSATCVNRYGGKV